ncbi:MAG TPA: hypothetical protein VF763_00715 [Candidatus Limnocylindrales bacterium]
MVADVGGAMDPLFVWSALGVKANTPLIGLLVENASPSLRAKYAGAQYQCPRPIGHLTITAIDGTTVHFQSSSGTVGIFDLSSQSWQFD